MLSRGNNLLQFLNSSLNEISATNCLVKYTKWLRALPRQIIGQLKKWLQKYVMSYFMSHSLLNNKNKENQGKSSSNLLNLRFWFFCFSNFEISALEIRIFSLHFCYFQSCLTVNRIHYIIYGDFKVKIVLLPGFFL